MGFEPDLAGPHTPMTAVPALGPSAIRRMTSIETARGAGDGSSTVVRAMAVDQLMDSAGEVQIRPGVELSALLDPGTDQIEEIRVDPDGPPLHALVGCTVGPGFRQRTVELLGNTLQPNSALHHLLDDWSGAHLVSGYALQRRALRGGVDRPVTDDQLATRVDVCAGWTVTGSIVRTARRTGSIPAALGPDIALTTEPIDPTLSAAGWPTPVGGTRRRRRLDLWRDGTVGLRFEEHFRDSFLEDDATQNVLHEYLVRGTIDPERMVVTSTEAHALVLPWRECPRALASASRIVGMAVQDLRPRVRNELIGTSTCTHLNDTLRALADVSLLSPLIPA